MTQPYQSTNLRPSHIDANGLNHFKKLARQLKKSSGVKYASALEQVSQDHGFKSWNNALKFAEINEKKNVKTASKTVKKPIQKSKMEDSRNQTLILPMVPVRNIVVFPGINIPFFMGRERSIEAINKAIKSDRKIFVVTQKDPVVENPSFEDVYKVGTVGEIISWLRLPKGVVKVLYRPDARAAILEAEFEASAYSASVRVFSPDLSEAVRPQILLEDFMKDLGLLVDKNLFPEDILKQIKEENQPLSTLTDLFSGLQKIVPVEEQQKLLEIEDFEKQLRAAHEVFLKSLEQPLTEEDESYPSIPPGKIEEFSPERIVLLRKVNKLSRGKLAAFLNVSQSTVRRWEIGQSKPSGPSKKLLTLIEKKGLAGVSS